MVRGVLLALAALALGCDAAAAEATGETWAADLKVESSELAAARPMDTYLYSVFVRNGGDDTARNAELIILLPLNTRVGAVEGCKAGAQGAVPGTTGTLRCALGDLTAGDARKLQFLIRTNAAHAACTAIAVSDTPDPNPMNNIRN